MKEIYYLAGGFYDGWRDRIILGMGLEDGEYFSPEQHNDQRAALTFVRDDLAAIDKATAVIARLNPNHACRGTAAEIGYAFATGKPVLLIMEDMVPELFLVALSQRLFASVEAFLGWHAERKAKGLPIVSRPAPRGALKSDPGLRNLMEKGGPQHVPLPITWTQGFCCWRAIWPWHRCRKIEASVQAEPAVSREEIIERFGLNASRCCWKRWFWPWHRCDPFRWVTFNFYEGMREIILREREAARRLPRQN